MAFGIPNPYTPNPTPATPSGSVMDQAANMSPNFINPSYATPQQVEQLRYYANSLMQHANYMPVKSGWQGLAQMANAGIGGLFQNQADQKQRQLIEEQRQGEEAGATILEGQNNNQNQSQAVAAPQSTSSLSYAPTSNGAQNQSSQDMPSMVNDIFSSRGIDPSLAMRVINGEGGFNGSKMAVGDDGSSFGPMQFHYGGISSKYPNPGLGDAFTRDTDLDASDPSTVRQQLEYAANRVATNGWGDWKGSSSHSDITGMMGVTPNAHPLPITPLGTTPVPQGQVSDTSNSSAPPSALAFSGNSAPTPPPASAAIQQGTIGGGPINAMISALRGNSSSAPMQGQMPNPAMIGSILANPTVSEATKQAIRQYITPTTVPGPLGQQVQTSQAAIAAGRSGAVAASPGQILNIKAGNGVEAPVYQNVGPNGQAPTPGSILGPGGTSTPNNSGGPVKPFNAPGTPIGAIIGAGQDQAVLAKKKQDNFDEYQQARAAEPALQASAQPLHSLQSIIEKNNGVLATGPGADNIAQIQSIANLVSTYLGHPLSSDDTHDTANQLFAKYGGQVAAEQAKQLNIRPTNLDLLTTQSTNPNTAISGPANLHLVDYAVRMNDLAREQSRFKQNYYNDPQNNHSFDGYNEAWNHNIGVDQAGSPNARVLSKFPVKSVPGSELGRNDGSTWDQVQSTDPTGFSWKQRGSY